MIAYQIRKATIKLASLFIACLLSMASFAAIDVYDFDSVQQEAQYRGLIEELRCPKCQNQNLAGSDAPIAQDLKQKTYDLVKDGRSDGWFWQSKRRQLVASGESGVAVDNHVKALTAAEKAELDRLLSRANNDDKDDTTSLGGKK